MRNRAFPLLLLGISGLGLICASDRGRKHLRRVMSGVGGVAKSVAQSVAQSKDPLGEFHRAVERQIGHIQQTLDQLSEVLEG
ncbi:MAG TPA: hypothetical protein VKZ53_16535 [Candidatus Angelobacter sp.]|nr:hypothetical protein [Candidatus Angelobacter sp.]